MRNSAHPYNKDLLDKLTDLRARCIEYQCQLIGIIFTKSKYSNHYLNAFSTNPPIKSESIFALLEALQFERDLAGNLAGKLIIEWHAGEWSIGNTDFLKMLTPEDKRFLKQNLLSKHNFSETDIKEVLQDLLINKFDLLKSSMPQPRDDLSLQYQFLYDIRTQIDQCIQSTNNHERKTLHDQLFKLNELIQNIQNVLLSKSKKTTLFFSGHQMLSNPIKVMSHEVDDLLEQQKQLTRDNSKIP